MNLENWIMIIGIFIFVALRQVGEKEYTAKKLIVPIGISIFLIYKYVSIPTTKSGIEWIAGLVVLGTIFGLISLSVSRFSIKDNIKYVKSGWAYVAVWVVALGSRVAIIKYVSKINPARSYIFMLKHGLTIITFTTMLIFFTIAMILVKTLGIYIIFYKKQLSFKKI